MTGANSQRVFYVKALHHASYGEVMARRPDIRLDCIRSDEPSEADLAVMTAAQIYQISSTRGELHQSFFCEDWLLSRTPNLLAVSTNAAGYDTIDLDACTKAGVLAVNQAGGNSEAVAEHVLGMMLALSKRIVQSDKAMRTNVGLDRSLYMGSDVLGKTIGIVGLGHVGTRIAELCRGLFRMRVLAFDPYLSAETVRARGAEKTDLDSLLRQADFVSLNCPLTKETRGMIGAREIGLMQRHAFLVSTARGGIHDEDFLAAALIEGRIAGAGLDVWLKEPPPPDHPLLRLDNVIASPHIAGVTHEARSTIARMAAEQVIDMLDGKPPSRILNLDVWPAYAARFERAFGKAPEAPGSLAS